MRSKSYILNKNHQRQYVFDGFYSKYIKNILEVRNAKKTYALSAACIFVL